MSTGLRRACASLRRNTVRLADIRRLLGITRVFVRHDLDEFIVMLHLFRPYRHVLRLAPRYWFRRARPSRAERLRLALEELGPIFIKFGQMLSTRPDLLPDDIAQELTRLQDKVPPFPGAQAVAIVETALGQPIDRCFLQFDVTPVASASIAQVHFAILKDGTEVAVKVLRPDIEGIIERDVRLLYLLARLANRYSKEARRLRPVEVVSEYDKVIHDEMDLMREAASASQLRANFKDSELLYVPKIYWDYTRRSVMVMERITGTPIGNVELLKSQGVDMQRLAHNGVEIFFTQAFRDGFFHADMHPGNIFVAPSGQYRAVDFGIMGTLSEEDKSYLAQNFLGFFNRDYRAVAIAHVRAGWVPPDTRADEFEAAIRTVCEPVFAKPLKDISFGRVLVRLFETARRFDMQIQPQLVLLQKTLFNIEGLGRRLYPDLDLWITAKPFLERWMQDQIGPKALLRAMRREFPRWVEILPRFPGLLHDALAAAASTDRTIAPRTPAQPVGPARRTQRRWPTAITGAALLVVAAVLLVTPITATWSRTAALLLVGAGIALVLSAAIPA
ncbi:MAG: ubiquinone biosynthesis regulatory protein kinase UbiB [Acidiferrobacteraceae bacterium]